MNSSVETTFTAEKPRLMGSTKCLKDLKTPQKNLYLQEGDNSIPSEGSLPSTNLHSITIRPPKLLSSLRAIPHKDISCKLEQKELKHFDFLDSTSSEEITDKLKSPLVNDQNSLQGWGKITVKKSKLSPRTYISGTSVSSRKIRTSNRKFTFTTAKDPEQAQANLGDNLQNDAELHKDWHSQIKGIVTSSAGSHRIIVSPNKLTIGPAFLH